MLKVAITGGIASGKSSALKAAEQLGFPTFSADLEITKIYQNGPVLLGLSKLFDIKDVTKENLKPILLKERAKLRLLEKILYKELVKKMKYFERKSRLSRHALCFFEIPLLFEKRMEKNYDFIINVDLPRFLQKSRFFKRNGANISEFNKFTSMQLISQKRRMLTQRLNGATICNIYNNKRLILNIKSLIKLLVC